MPFNEKKAFCRVFRTFLEDPGRLLKKAQSKTCQIQQQET